MGRFVAPTAIVLADTLLLAHQLITILTRIRNALAHGKHVSFDERLVIFRGRLTTVNVLASWCLLGPCTILHAESPGRATEFKCARALILHRGTIIGSVGSKEPSPMGNYVRPATINIFYVRVIDKKK